MFSDAFETTHGREELPVSGLRQSFCPIWRVAQTFELLPRRHETLPVSSLPAILQRAFPPTFAHSHGRKTLQLRNLWPQLCTAFATQSPHANAHWRATGTLFLFHLDVFWIKRKLIYFKLRSTSARYANRPFPTRRHSSCTFDCTRAKSLSSVNSVLPLSSNCLTSRNTCAASTNKTGQSSVHKFIIRLTDPLDSFYWFRPYVCLPCNEFFQTKNELTLHTASHNAKEKDPEDQENQEETDNDEENSSANNEPSTDQQPNNKTQLVELPNGTKIELQNVQNGQLMSLERMRMLLAILLKRISTPNRLRRLGYGSKLIDIVLVKSIESSGRKPVDNVTAGSVTELDTRSMLKGNIEILLDWTIPREYMDHFRQEKKTVEEILEELTS